jgi:hypothetical protein
VQRAAIDVQTERCIRRIGKAFGAAQARRKRFVKTKPKPACPSNRSSGAARLRPQKRSAPGLKIRGMQKFFADHRIGKVSRQRR